MKRLFCAMLAMNITNFAWAEDFGKITKIDVPEKEVTAYNDGKGWTGGSIKFPVEKVAVPLLIIAKSGMRYKVSIDGQEVWLDRHDVVADTPVIVPADCEPRRLTNSSSATTRGLGEPCKSDPPKSNDATMPPAAAAPKAIAPRKSVKGKKK